MKNLSIVGAHKSFVLVLLFLALLGVWTEARSNARAQVFSKGMSPSSTEETWEQQYPTGSSLPDCSNACMPCVPCKRVMISYKCAMESCPIVYRCTCRGKFYHVPSH